MKALQIRRNVAKLGMARIASAISPGTAARVGPLEYRTIDEPALPGPGWHRVHTRLAGICGSDLSLVEGHASLYFEDWVSFPFVPGHEVVGELDDGTRVVLEPVLGHEARGFEPPFDGAAPGDGDDYAHLATSGAHVDLEPGIQTGFCCSTGGGWAPEFVAHESQLHRIGDDMPDERAVLVEPLAGGIHAALLTWPRVADATDPVVAVLGAGTMGLAAVAGLRRYVPGVRIVVGARYPHQQSIARAFGADEVVRPDELPRAVRRMVGCHVVGGHLTSGAHATIDAVGTGATVAECLRITRPRGRVVLLGMPADVTLDLTGLWHRETELKGAYTYGTETMPDGRRVRTFELALETATALGAERMLSATYGLADHVDAIAHAASAGRRGGVKVAFDLRASLPNAFRQPAAAESDSADPPHGVR
jgi:threonine dehydrogenase-like Zn-dependent dehydrogenase